MKVALHWSRWVGGGVVVAWVLSVLWWALLEPVQANASGEELVIPEGTASAVEAGARAPFIPSALELGRDGELVVINNDVVAHRVGSWTVLPGERATISSDSASGQLTCTIHPGGVLDFTVAQRPSLWVTGMSALMLGLPIGAVFGFAALVAGRLKVEEGG